jgi:hypothetical protein
VPFNRPNFAVKKRGPSRSQPAKVLAHATWPFAVIISLATIGGSLAFGRAWSYHYNPITAESSPAASATQTSITQATPAPAEQLSTARVLKREIVSDLALFIQEQGVRSDKAYADHSAYLVRRLSLFDSLGSPEALAMFASLSGYYLGARGEELYDCLSLRKGKALEPYLEKYVRNGNAECSQELGQSFTKPSDALRGYALCPSGQQQKAHLTSLIAEIDSSQSCSDSKLAAVTASPQPSSADTR